MPRSKAKADGTALFRTANLNLAAYLVASTRLVFHHAEPYAKHSEFFFHDPESLGPVIAAEFVTQDLQISAKLLLEARSSLNEIRRGGGAA